MPRYGQRYPLIEVFSGACTWLDSPPRPPITQETGRRAFMPGLTTFLESVFRGAGGPPGWSDCVPIRSRMSQPRRTGPSHPVNFGGRIGPVPRFVSLFTPRDAKRWTYRGKPVIDIGHT